MKTTIGGLMQGLLATVALCWSGFGLLCSPQIVLPARTFTSWGQERRSLRCRSRPGRARSTLRWGYLALLSGCTEGNSHLPPSCDVEDTGVSAVAAFYPPTDLGRLYEMEWPRSNPNVVGLGSSRRFLGSTPSTVPDLYRISSPIERVDPDDPPTFLVHGAPIAWCRLSNPIYCSPAAAREP